MAKFLRLEGKSQFEERLILTKESLKKDVKESEEEACAIEFERGEMIYSEEDCLRQIFKAEVPKLFRLAAPLLNPDFPKAPSVKF